MTERDTPWPPGTPCWLQLLTTDAQAAAEFYRQLFGWQIGDNGMASVGGRAVAGIAEMADMHHPPVWGTYLATADLEASAQAVRAAGGRIVTEPTDVGELGKMMFALAPGGGVFGCWQAGKHIGVERANEANTVVWNEFLGRDYAASKAFFAAVFGYTYTELGNGDFQYATIEVDGNTVGGIGTLPAEVPEQVPPHWRVYFAVEDCDAAVARALDFGASVLRAPADMPYGRHADLADPQSAPFSVIKPADPAA